MFAKEKLVSEAVVKVRKILHLMTGSNHNYAGTSFLSFSQVVDYTLSEMHRPGGVEIKVFFKS